MSIFKPSFTILDFVVYVNIEGYSNTFKCFIASIKNFLKPLTKIIDSFALFYTGLVSPLSRICIVEHLFYEKLSQKKGAVRA
jgi:hypothetical protein